VGSDVRCADRAFERAGVLASGTVPQFIATEGAARLAGQTGTVGILASPAVRRIGLFDRVFGAAGLTALYPQDDAAMLATIRLIKAQGVTPAARSALAAASNELATAGAHVQMLACTEFSLISEAVDPEAQAFDTLDRLVEGILAFAITDSPDRTKPEMTTRSAKAPQTHPNKESAQ